MPAFYPNIAIAEHAVFSQSAPGFSLTFINRLKTFYRDVFERSGASGASMWVAIYQKNKGVHDALLANDDSLLHILQNPGATDFFYGFDNLHKEHVNSMREANANLDLIARDIAGDVLRLTEAVGATRLWNQEGGERYPANTFPQLHDVNAMIDDLSRQFGFTVLFPNPFPDEFGVITKNGIISHRAVQSLYQAYRIAKMVKSTDDKVLEIGAGLGRNVYYARQFGILDYTIVDLPLTNVAQATFLALVLGEDAISLGNEPPASDQVKIRAPEWLFASQEFFQLALNVDSIVEFDQSVANEYCRFLSERAKTFISINHEANKFIIGDLSSLRGRAYERFPYWMRSGYCEQIYNF